MKIYITVTEEGLDFRAEAMTHSFEVAEQKLDQMKRSYERRAAMEPDAADVMAESLKEEGV